MTLQRLGMVGQLCLVQAASFGVWILSTAVFPDRLVNVPFGIALIFGSFFVYARLWAPFRRMCRRMSEVARRMGEDEAQARAQHSLDRNIGLLHERLYALGQPSRVGDDLFFGEHRINGDLEQVDYVKEQAGGTATIFCGDLRIATNVLNSEGKRAIGTRLAAGPVHDRLFNDRKAYRGEADILGVSYVTVYEPILDGAEVIGILFVGVPKAESRLDETVKIGGENSNLSEIERIVVALEMAAEAKAQAEREPAKRRQEAEDVRREHEALSKTASSQQSEVVNALSIALEHLSDGDLTYRVTAKFPPDYEKLKDYFNSTGEQLHKTVAMITGNAQSIRTSSEHISHSAVDLARRTEEQAQALEETSASLAKLTAMVNETAQGAKRANAIVTSTRSKTDWSRDVMKEAVAAMADIDKSANEIGQIIGLIDELALQTNLLALNAGVEAARAGDAGKGFAVIASEVRVLASRSTDAAKKIKALITASAANIESGVRLVGDTNKSLEEILSQFADISSVVADIADSAQSQAAGLTQINGALAAMERVTQQNHAMVEDSKAASQELAADAETLAELMDSFMIDAAAEIAPSGVDAKVRRAS